MSDSSGMGRLLAGDSKHIYEFPRGCRLKYPVVFPAVIASGDLKLTMGVPALVVFSPTRVVRWTVSSLLLMACVSVVYARPQRAVLTPWEQAERGRETLEAIPTGTRTRADYDRALNGFRAVYHATPGDMHAPESVFAVAELLAEEGRTRRDTKTLTAAIGQY